MLVSHNSLRGFLPLWAMSPQRVRQFYDYVDTAHPYVANFGFEMRRRDSVYDSFLIGLEHLLEILESFTEVGQPRRGLSLSARREYEMYQRLIRQVRGSEREIQDFTPDQFVRWVTTWSRGNSPEFSVETDYFRSFVWNLVNAGVIRPWPDGFVVPQRTPRELMDGHVRRLQSLNPHVRRTAADALREMGPAAREVLPALTRALDAERMPSVRAAIQGALRRISGEPQAGAEEGRGLAAGGEACASGSGNPPLDGRCRAVCQLSASAAHGGQPRCGDLHHAG